MRSPQNIIGHTVTRPVGRGQHVDKGTGVKENTLNHES